MGDPKRLCDFCSRELQFGSTWVFPCRDHVSVDVPLLPFRSAGDWSACRACKDLIVAGKRDKLLKRAMRQTLRDVPHEVAEEGIRHVQDTFWSNRSGPPRAETREEWTDRQAPRDRRCSPAHEGIVEFHCVGPLGGPQSVAPGDWASGNKWAE